MTQLQDELDQIKAKIQHHLVTSGNYEIINKQLKLQLYESGWFDQVSLLARKELDQHQEGKDGRTVLSFDQLFELLKPKAEDLVPKEVKNDMLNRIKDYLEEVIE
ncbi:SAGA histone acetylase and TREX-2 complexes component [Scheffersomyces spartinae]|uniref:Transcription and mRNA export factor SUS1 n=1 Tax=Scheffersomyces spartinae TaxID=45513 RepID=A0A9P8AHM7_9ASCO|nr:SAGA histone acetylase and TREX-2 complexes component [Scheffersomyces spartinae]KAG7193527.1 SAGA histone acetylase and TREX-2 complexes component [Scheffersomyces spartinae]